MRELMVDVHDAETRFDELLEAAERGTEWIITRAGTPVARLSPCWSKRKIAAPGGMERQGYWIAADFDAPVD